LVGLIADITREEADDLLVAGDPQNAASHMRDFWIVRCGDVALVVNPGLSAAPHGFHETEVRR
jgi:hypothetical protein